MKYSALRPQPLDEVICRVRCLINSVPDDPYAVHDVLSHVAKTSGRASARDLALEIKSVIFGGPR